MHNPTTLKYLSVFILFLVTTGNEFGHLTLVHIYKTQRSAMEFDAVISLTSKVYQN